MNWPIIFASASVSFALVAGVFAWIATHPHKAAPSPQSLRVAVVELPAVARTRQAPPQTLEEEKRRKGEKEKEHPASVSSSPLLLLSSSPPLPPPASPQPEAVASGEWRTGSLRCRVMAQTRQLTLPVRHSPLSAAGQTYGTQVLFLNSQGAAADRASHEHKLMFVMHISGNFEDSCFT